jgi:hypothetical protein
LRFEASGDDPVASTPHRLRVHCLCRRDRFDKPAPASV